MCILSISVGLPRIIRHMGKDVPTAIYKAPVVGPVVITQAGVDGDRQANLEVHGGPDKTVLAFAIENYAFYQERAGGAAFGHGHFGENLTMSGLIETEVRIGDIYRAGTTLLEVTMPRMPCFKFGIRLGASKAQADCIASGRTGFYLRVLEAGSATAGDAISRIRSDIACPTVHEVHRLRFHDKDNVAGMTHALKAAALAKVVSDEFAERLRYIAGRPVT